MKTARCPICRGKNTHNSDCPKAYKHKEYRKQNKYRDNSRKSNDLNLFFFKSR
jgi:hypothetical protein